MTDFSGKHDINEQWKLYIEGKLRTVFVSHLEISKLFPDERRYIVKHFGSLGDVLTTLTLDQDDLEPVLG